MPAITIRVVKPVNLKVSTSTVSDMRAIGNQAVAIMRDGVAMPRDGEELKGRDWLGMVVAAARKRKWNTARAPIG